MARRSRGRHFHPGLFGTAVFLFGLGLVLQLMRVMMAGSSAGQALAIPASLVLLAGLVLGVVGYARRPKASPPRRDAVPTLTPADSTDFLPSTIAAPIRPENAHAPRGDSRRFEDSE